MELRCFVLKVHVRNSRGKHPFLFVLSFITFSAITAKLIFYSMYIYMYNIIYTKSSKSEQSNSRSTTPKATESAKSQLRSGRKFRAQEEIENSWAILAFEVDRHGVACNHFEMAASAPAKAALIIQERRRQMDTERIALAVQQRQQSQWTTWDEVLQRSVTWKDI